MKEFCSVANVKIVCLFVLVWFVGSAVALLANQLGLLPAGMIPITGFGATVFLLIGVFRHGGFSEVYMVNSPRLRIENRVATAQGVILIRPSKMTNVDTGDEEDIFASSVWNDMSSSSQSALIISK